MLMMIYKCTRAFIITCNQYAKLIYNFHTNGTPYVSSRGSCEAFVSLCHCFQAVGSYQAARYSRPESQVWYLRAYRNVISYLVVLTISACNCDCGACELLVSECMIESAIGD